MSLEPKQNKIIESKGIRWKLLEQINRGGNGFIWKASEELNPSSICVFKFLPKTNRTIELSRLRREFEVHTRLYQETYNVLPIFDYSLNHDDYSWVRLPLAKTFNEGVKETAFIQKIQLLIQLANDIQTLHNHGYCHRDIKPNNLLFLDNKLYLADFGLVTDPWETAEITPNGTRMGNYQTIAPEMRKTGKNLDIEDYKKSDIYSLGVTIWMILCEDEHGFDGEYSQTQKQQLENKLNYEKIVVTDIHNIMEGCTKTHSHERILLADVITILNKIKSYLISNEQYIDSKWHDVCNRLNPYQASKIELKDIKAIYNFIQEFYAFEPDLHHAFFPDTGGLDIRGIELNEKDEFIILNLGSFKIWLKPKRLIYKHFEHDISNNYIYLECANIPYLQDGFSFPTMEYTLINNQFLTDFKHWQSAIFEENNIQKIASRITIVHNGSFLFAKSFSAYDRSDECYDGIHSRNFDNFEDFDEYFCSNYAAISIKQNEIALPFEYKIEEKNISPTVPFKFLDQGDLQTIFDRFTCIEPPKSEKWFEKIISHNNSANKMKAIFEQYSSYKIKELWCLYNLGKQLNGAEINQNFYDEFYTNLIDDDGICLSKHDCSSLSKKINGIIKGTLIHFINRGLTSLKHTVFLEVNI